MITQREWEEWTNHPVTQEYHRILKLLRHRALEDWANKKFVGDTPEHTIQANAHALGGVGILERLVTLDIDDLESIEKEIADGREQGRYIPPWAVGFGITRSSTNPIGGGDSDARGSNN